LQSLSMSVPMTSLTRVGVGIPNTVELSDSLVDKIENFYDNDMEAFEYQSFRFTENNTHMEIDSDSHLLETWSGP
jgi:hypothetical protein